MNDTARNIPQPPTSTRDWLITAVLITVIVASVALLALTAAGLLSG